MALYIPVPDWLISMFWKLRLVIISEEGKTKIKNNQSLHNWIKNRIPALNYRMVQ